MKAIIVGGLGFGDESKGSTTDYLVRRHKAKTVVRYNGAPQAAHNTVSPEGIHHCSAQFGSGTLAGARTYLSRFVLVDPIRLLTEAKALERLGISRPLEHQIIDRRCAVITPFHAIVNQMQEIARGKNRHGSCGMGVGQAARDAKLLGQEMLRVQDFENLGPLHRKLDFIWRMKLDLAEQLVMEHPSIPGLWERLKKLERPSYVSDVADAYEEFLVSGIELGDENTLPKIIKEESCIVFEGAQGALLDATRAFPPYVTQSNTTFENALVLLKEASFRGEIEKYGVLRAYFTRHGAGPFPTENAKLTREIPDQHNKLGKWQGKFRIGWFDCLLARYALEMVGGVDHLALTNLDRLGNFENIEVCTGYRSEEDHEALSQFFSAKRQNGFSEITGIRKINQPTVERQTILSQLLFGCRPVLQKVPAANSENHKIKTADYVQFLKGELKSPVTLLSFGPTAKDKIEI